MSFTVHALYKFVALPDFAELRDPLQACCDAAGVSGTLLLAREGINGTVAGTTEALDTMWAHLRADARFADIEPKVSDADTNPFYRMKVRLKKEIVTMGVPGLDPTQRVGTYVTPEQWNALISDPEVCLIDTRNDYEVAIGKFKGAINPHTDTFREFPDYVARELDPTQHRKVAMYCTGGIRCEKASAYLLEQGFEEVFHLEGGILKYLEDVPAETSTWEGDCFVFDQRVAVGHGLEQGDYELCHSCRHPLSEADRTSSLYEAGVSCPNCHGQSDAKRDARKREREQQMRIAETRGAQHLGQRMRRDTSAS